jgi:hypothetical protein
MKLGPTRSFADVSRTGFIDEVPAGHVRCVEIDDQEATLGESTTRGLENAWNWVRFAKQASPIRGLA